MSEVNFAENDKRLWEEPTIKEAERMGNTHAAYGWGMRPGHWSEEHIKAYKQGYLNWKENASIYSQ